MAIKNLAIFDIDGTLHKTEVMSLASFRVVCAEYALPVPDMQTLYQTYGANEQTLMDLLGAPQDEAYRKRFYARIDQEESRQMRLVGQRYEGVLESLRKPRDAGRYACASLDVQQPVSRCCSDSIVFPY